MEPQTKRLRFGSPATQDASTRWPAQAQPPSLSMTGRWVEATKTSFGSGMRQWGACPSTHASLAEGHLRLLAAPIWRPLARGDIAKVLYGTGETVPFAPMSFRQKT